MEDESYLFKASLREPKKKDVEAEEAALQKEKTRLSREVQPSTTTRTFEFGDKGSNWRMMKLSRIYEIAKEDNISVEEVARDRYSDLKDYLEALDERAYLDGIIRTEKIKGSGYRSPIMKNDLKVPNNTKRVFSEVESMKKVVIGSKKLVPIEPLLTTDQLNKLSSQVLKARMHRLPELDRLEEKYLYEKFRKETMQESITLKDKKAKVSVVEEEKSIMDMVKEEKSANFKYGKDTQECHLCYHEDLPPKVSIIAMGLKSYLALPSTIDMVPYHCMIVPLNHVNTTLALDDDVWMEIRNFQKSLIRMCEKIGQGVLFMEQVVEFGEAFHTVVECIPVPKSTYNDSRAYFKEALEEIEGDYTQHRPVISTDKGFRRSMVGNLAYFHVWFDPNRGMGHVIEDAKEWPRWFGKEVLGKEMDLGVEKWRKPKIIDSSEVAKRSRTFISLWKDFDWTLLLS